MSALDEMQTTLSKVAGKAFVEDVTKRAAKRIEKALEETLGAGESPDGKAWAPRKSGGRAYAAAASRLNVKAIGTLVRVTVSGPEAHANYGTRRMQRRQMIPQGGDAIPALIGDALDEAAREAFEVVTK